MLELVLILILLYLAMKIVGFSIKWTIILAVITCLIKLIPILFL